MSPADLDDRLSRIATRWTTVYRAHAATASGAEDARHRLMLRYSGAAYRYLLGAVRDPDVAADLCQEFAVRFLRGDFRRADPGRGRFRDYLKRSLSHLVTDHHRARQAGPVALAADAAEPAAAGPGDEPDFAAGWRQDVLDQTWKALKDENPTFHAVLILRIESPDMASPEMADRLTGQLGKPMTPENVRKSLQRAQAKFADLMLDQVTDSLDDPADLEPELRELDLLKYCRTALVRRQGRNGG